LVRASNILHNGNDVFDDVEHLFEVGHDLFKLGGSALTIRPQPDEQSL
jgi:hypothetical protein